MWLYQLYLERPPTSDEVKDIIKIFYHSVFFFTIIFITIFLQLAFHWSGPNQNSGNHYHITSRAHFQFGHVLTCNLTLLSCNMRPGGQLGFQASALSASQAFLSQLDTCLRLSQAKLWTQNAGIFFFIACFSLRFESNKSNYQISARLMLRRIPPSTNCQKLQ